jgi:hypothetical protein
MMGSVFAVNLSFDKIGAGSDFCLYKKPVTSSLKFKR